MQQQIKKEGKGDFFLFFYGNPTAAYIMYLSLASELTEKED